MSPPPVPSAHCRPNTCQLTAAAGVLHGDCSCRPLTLYLLDRGAQHLWRQACTHPASTRRQHGRMGALRAGWGVLHGPRFNMWQGGRFVWGRGRGSLRSVGGQGSVRSVGGRGWAHRRRRARAHARPVRRGPRSSRPRPSGSSTRSPTWPGAKKKEFPEIPGEWRWRWRVSPGPPKGPVRVDQVLGVDRAGVPGEAPQR